MPNIQNPAIEVPVGGTVNLVIQPGKPDGVTPSGGSMNGLNWNTSASTIANPGTALNADGTLPVQILLAGDATITAASVVTDTNGVVVQNATGSVELTATAEPITGGLLITLKAS